MKLLTSSEDRKITAINHLIEMNIGEYSQIAKDIIYNNDLQRKRVKTANRTYSLLKDDIRTGCVIPPIVLAKFPMARKGNNNTLTSDEIIKTILSEGKELLILDGLQRTYTILDLLNEVDNDIFLKEKIESLPLRIEVYSGISKIGVLYRMLTLNTSQTPMSTRHQIEMIYSDYKNGIDGLKFISEADNRIPSGNNEFKFSDILDGFLSYITGNYLPIDREDLADIIKNLEVLTKDDKQQDLFKLFVNSYNTFRIKFNLIGKDWTYFDISDDLRKKPFAISINALFSKVQFLAGYGAALSFLTERNAISGIDAIDNLIQKIYVSDIEDTLNLMIKHLDDIQLNAKKIGNEQRMYFYYFVRDLFNDSSDGYLNIEKSVLQAYRFYKANSL